MSKNQWVIEVGSFTSALNAEQSYLNTKLDVDSRQNVTSNSSMIVILGFAMYNIGQSHLFLH